MSNEKNPGCLGYVRDYTTQIYRDYSKPLYGSLLTNQYFMESVAGFFSWLKWLFVKFTFPEKLRLEGSLSLHPVCHDRAQSTQRVHAGSPIRWCWRDGWCAGWIDVKKFEKAHDMELIPRISRISSWRRSEGPSEPSEACKSSHACSDFNHFCDTFNLCSAGEAHFSMWPIATAVWKVRLWRSSLGGRW